MRVARERDEFSFFFFFPFPSFLCTAKHKQQKNKKKKRALFISKSPKHQVVHRRVEQRRDLLQVSRPRLLLGQHQQHLLLLPCLSCRLLCEAHQAQEVQRPGHREHARVQRRVAQPQPSELGLGRVGADVGDDLEERLEAGLGLFFRARLFNRDQDLALLGQGLFLLLL